MVEIAYNRSRDPTAKIPFAELAAAANRLEECGYGENMMGGKPDDIVVSLGNFLL